MCIWAKWELWPLSFLEEAFVQKCNVYLLIINNGKAVTQLTINNSFT